MCVYMHMCASVHTTACMWRSESNMLKSVLFFYSMGPGVQHSGFSLDGKVLYLQAGTEITS